MANKRTLDELLEDYIDRTKIWSDGRVYFIKEYVGRARDLKFHVWPGDHNPPHFHVLSTQRNINAKFHLHTLELNEDKTNKIRRDDEKKIKSFF